MATVELAVAFPAVVLVLALCLTAMTFAVDLVRCEDAARAGARAASRGEPTAVVREIVAARSPRGSVATVEPSEQVVAVRISAPPRVRLLPSLPGAEATAVAAWEPGVQP